jgi:hypothetical protein
VPKRGVELDTGFEHVFDMRDGKAVRFENKPDDAETWIEVEPPPKNPITQSEEERMQWANQLQLVGSRWA